MSNSIPHQLPDCLIIQQLDEKAKKRTEADFNFVSRLDDLRKRVVAEVRHINELFPEYTPHDEMYHLKNLFGVANKVLGDQLISTMTCEELFLLAVGLYAHDWGMAVSQREKELILAGGATDVRRDDVSLLRDEHERFAKFAKTLRLKPDDKGAYPEVPVEAWRIYVRDTHAERSGERVRRFFEKDGQGIGDAAGRVCTAHTLDFTMLEPTLGYPRDFTVLGQPVNLPAISVYVRLIDLLDIADDRTPYAVWHFVTPRDPTSKMEWAKHRALNPVGSAQYQDGRRLIFDGSTDDHEVYAALEDLRDYVQDQFRGCMNVLARLRDPNHTLRIYYVEWRVAAERFDPVSVRFEFHREQMFNILSDEIYQGDAHVFLRELLQNSIDAIKTRRAVLERHQVGVTVGTIRVEVQHGTGGDAVITWTDDGIGMDEHVIRNYLAVAGRSYYQSDDFKNLGLEFDPISRFGIGLLSCFMVADRVEINTRMEPYHQGTTCALAVDIPAVDRRFRVEKRPPASMPTGTTVTVYVKGEKRADEDNEDTDPLRVTDYLKAVAGFVDFPILVTEGEHKTAIVKPDYEVSPGDARFEGFEVSKLDLTYPWKDNFIPQDLDSALEVFEERRYDVRNDLKLEGVEGVMLFAIPRERFFLARYFTNDFGYAACRPVDWKVGIPQTDKIRFRKSYRLDDDADRSSGSRSAICGVYRNGVLVSGARLTKWVRRAERYRERLAPPMFMVNLSVRQAARIDVSRRMLMGTDTAWIEHLWGALIDHIAQNELAKLAERTPMDRLRALARLRYCWLAVEELYERSQSDLWPVAVLEPGQSLTIAEWSRFSGDELVAVPALANDVVEDAAVKLLCGTKHAGSLLAHWDGEVPCVWLSAGSSRNLGVWGGLLGGPMRGRYAPAKIEFIEPPWTRTRPAYGERLRRRGANGWIPIREAKWQAASEELPVQASKKKTTRNRWLGQFPETVEFGEPYAHSFAYGFCVWNATNEKVQRILDLIVACAVAELTQSHTRVELGRLYDGWQRTVDLSGSHASQSLGLSAFLALAADMGFLSTQEAKDLVPEEGELVPDTSDVGRYTTLWSSEDVCKRRWGRPLAGK